MTAKKVIYLDYNIFESYRVNDVEGLRAVVDGLKDDHVLPYSPAHMEDLASSLAWRDFEEDEIKVALERCQERLQNVIDISKMVEVFPGKEHQPTQIVVEHPGACLVRVLEHFARNRFLDVRERLLLERIKATDTKGERSSKISNLPVDFLSATEYALQIQSKLEASRELMNNKKEAGLEDFKWPSISKSHAVLEHVFEILMNYLEEVRFRPEEVKKSRSRMHDVTHAIYATKADIFVTGDDRFYHKIKVAYHYLNVPTKILSLEEFIKQGDSSL
jgi:hypothetical protein